MPSPRAPFARSHAEYPRRPPQAAPPRPVRPPRTAGSRELISTALLPLSLRSYRGVGSALEQNRAEANFLKGANVAPAYQLEQGHEGCDYQRAIVRILKQCGELDSSRVFQRAQNPWDAFRHRDVAQLDFARGLVCHALEHGANRLDQVENRDRVRHGVRVFGRSFAGGGEDVAS